MFRQRYRNSDSYQARSTEYIRYQQTLIIKEHHPFVSSFAQLQNYQSMETVPLKLAFMSDLDCVHNNSAFRQTEEQAEKLPTLVQVLDCVLKRSFILPWNNIMGTVRQCLIQYFFLTLEHYQGCTKLHNQDKNHERSQSSQSLPAILDDSTSNCNKNWDHGLPTYSFTGRTGRSTGHDGYGPYIRVR